MNNKKYSVVCFFAREHGLSGLETLIDSGRYKIKYLFTHKLKATFEEKNRGLRPDFNNYKEQCQKHNIPLFAADYKKDGMKIDRILNKIIEFDFIAAISWRRIIPANQLHIPKIGGVNLHRGKFPEYKGNFPLVRALEAKEKEIFITGHILNKEIDGGEVLKEVSHPVNYQETKSLAENTERLKKEITPYFGLLLIESLNLMVERYENG